MVILLFSSLQCLCCFQVNIKKNQKNQSYHKYCDTSHVGSLGCWTSLCCTWQDSSHTHTKLKKNTISKNIERVAIRAMFYLGEMDILTNDFPIHHKICRFIFKYWDKTRLSLFFQDFETSWKNLRQWSFDNGPLVMELTLEVYVKNQQPIGSNYECYP